MSGLSMDHVHQTGSHREPRIIMIYALVGPPFGGMIVFLMFLISASFGETWRENLHDDFSGTIFSLIGAAIGFPVMGYPFGGVQALLTGLLIKTVASSGGRFGYLTAFLAPAFVGAAVTVLLTYLYYDGVGFAPISVFIAVGLIGIVASLIVRFLFRRRFGKQIHDDASAQTFT